MLLNTLLPKRVGLEPVPLWLSLARLLVPISQVKRQINSDRQKHEIQCSHIGKQDKEI